MQFWKQSDHLVQRPKIWQELKALDSSFTCAKLFWWYMYSGTDWSITPRPMYPADGRKVFDIYTFPSDLHARLRKPLANFLSPVSGGRRRAWPRRRERATA